MPGMLDHETYLSPLTWRYGSDEMRRIWSEVHRRQLLRRAWIALARAQHEAGLVTHEQIADLEAHQDQIDIERVTQIEAEIHHDLMAEVRAFAEQCPVGGPVLHLGATSHDIIDNADVLRTREALHLIRQCLVEILGALAERIEETAGLACMGYTHLQPAEPTTVGYRLAQYAQDLLADLGTIDRLLDSLRTKGFKGAVGTSASYTQLLQGTGWSAADLDRRATEFLDLQPFEATTQVVPRKQEWQILCMLAGVAQSLHRFAFDLRILQAPSFGEWRESFAKAQVGSSAMPFKQNPINAENICSLARYVAALPSVAWTNSAESLLERTLDDRANARLTLPGGFLATEEILLRATRLVHSMAFDEVAIAANLSRYGTFAATERLLMELAKAGADRQEMHEVIRHHSLAAWEAIRTGLPSTLVEQLAGDARLVRYLTSEQIRSHLDYSGYVGDAPQRARAVAQTVRDAIS